MEPEELEDAGSGPRPAAVGGLLQKHQAGVRDASGALVALVSAEIRRIAPLQARERAGASPDDQLAGLLVRVLSDCALAPEDRPPFLTIYAGAVRRVLCDDLPQHGPADPSDGSAAPELVLAIDGVLGPLERVNPRLVSVVECRYFAHLTEEETAAALGADIRTVQQEWIRARAWLLKELTTAHDGPGRGEVSVPNAAWVDAVLRNALSLREEDRPEFLAQCHAAGAGLRQDVEALVRLAEHGAPGVELGEISPAFVWAVLSRSEPIAISPEPDVVILPAAAFESMAVPPPLPAEPPVSIPAEPPAADDERRLGEWTITGELPPRGTGRLFAVERASGSARGVARILPVPATADRTRLFTVLCERLAGLRHPRIAPLLDHGTSPAGTFYLVHAVADGRPLSQHCARQRTTIRDRVRLMIQLCGAVQDAHRSLVAHGALTDSRILVDDDGALTIVDCGVEPLAGYLDDSGSDGRPVERASAASDVRQAGAVLHDLLLRRRGPGAEPLDPELASIVQFAAGRGGSDRYRSVGALRSDLHRWLERRPLLARGDARSYRLQRFTVRRRVPLLIGAAAVVAAAFLLPPAIANRERTAREAARADAVARMVAAVVDSRTSSVSAGPPEARTYVDRAAAVVRTELAAQPAQQSTMLLALGRAYNDLGAYQSSVEALEEALLLRRSSHGDDASEVADVLEPLGQAKAALGRYDEAESTLRMARAIRVLRAGAGQPPPGIVNVELARLLHRLGRTDEPALLLRGQLGNAAAGSASPAGGQDEVIVRARAALAGVLRDRGNASEAEGLYRQVLSSVGATRATPDPASEPQHLWKTAASKDLERARAQVGLAGVLIMRGETDEPATLLIDALQALRHLHGPDHPVLLEALRTQGRLRLAQQRLPEARAALAEAQRIHQESLGVFTLDVPANRVLQAELALREGRFEDGVAASRLVLDELERLELGDHPLTIDARTVLGEALAALGRGEEALQVLTRASDTAQAWVAVPDHRFARLNSALEAAHAATVRRAR